MYSRRQGGKIQIIELVLIEEFLLLEGITGIIIGLIPIELFLQRSRILKKFLLNIKQIISPKIITQNTSKNFQTSFAIETAK